MAIITNTDVKNYLDITETAYDSKITDYISKVESEIIEFIGQNIESGDTDVIFKGNGKSKTLLVNCPVTLVNTLSYRETPLEDWTVIDTDLYKLYYEDSVYWIYYDYFNSNYQYKANITYGYDTIPEALKMIAIEMTTDLILNSRGIIGNDGFRHGIVSKADSVNGYTSTTGFRTPYYLDRLAKYSVVAK